MSGHTGSFTVTLLGTGTPAPSPERFGSATLVEAGGHRFLFDAGRGVAIRLKEAGVTPPEVGAVFLTHLHSDHVVGLPDLWLTGWVMGRASPLRLFGPSGTRALGDQLMSAFGADLDARQRPPESLPASGARIGSVEIHPGVAYEDGPLRVTAFLVDHLNVRPAFGYRVDYDGHAVVISGDTRLSNNLVQASQGVDLLVHAAWLPEARNAKPAASRSIASAEDAGRVFQSVKPKLAVVTHYLDEDGLEAAVRSQYSGPLVVAKDLMVIDVGDKTALRHR